MTVPLEIRPVTADVIEEAMTLQACALRSLSTAHYSQPQIEEIVKSQETIRRRDFFKANSELLYGGWVEDRLVAISAISTWGGQIGGVYVHPDFARRGIGRQMLLKLEAVAIERRYKSITAMSSLVAVRLYESSGFGRVCSIKIRCGKASVPCLLMSKSLAYAYPKQDRSKELFTAICSIAACVVVVVAFM